MKLIRAVYMCHLLETQVKWSNANGIRHLAEKMRICLLRKFPKESSHVAMYPIEMQRRKNDIFANPWPVLYPLEIGKRIDV